MPQLRDCRFIRLQDDILTLKCRSAGAALRLWSHELGPPNAPKVERRVERRYLDVVVTKHITYLKQKYSGKTKPYAVPGVCLRGKKFRDPAIVEQHVADIRKVCGSRISPQEEKTTE